MEELELNGPIVLSHLENTGINIQTDRIAEISVIKFNPDNTEIEKTVSVHPTIPIPQTASGILAF